MANSRNPKRKGYDSNRDSGAFIAMPWSVLDCPAYARLSHPAKALLFEVARQFVKDNNGRLLISRAYMFYISYVRRLCRGGKPVRKVTSNHLEGKGGKPCFLRNSYRLRGEIINS